MTLFEAPVTHESNHYSNPYSNFEFEDEWEMPEAIQYSNPYSNPEFEDEWEMLEGAHYTNPYSNPELEADQFFFLAPLVAKIGAKIAGKLALKGAKKLAMKGAKKLISRAPKILNKIRKIQKFRDNLPQQDSGERPRRPPNHVLREGESSASALEAEFFGSNEFEGELANHTAAHEIALTELLANEAAQTESEREAEALLGKALPIAMRVMSGGTMLRQATPSLMQANTHLVRSLHRQGHEGRQFLRVASAIHRRTIGSLRAIQARGGQITPELVSRLMAAHTQMVLGTPSILGKALIRNFAIRRSTSVPVRQLMRELSTI